jgi:hypothetical protein
MYEMFKGAKNLWVKIFMYSEQIIFNNEACYTLFVIALR